LYATPGENDLHLEDYDKALEVSSGEFDAVHANKYQNPDNFRQQLWNDAGPTVDSMMIQLSMINDNLADDEAGILLEWMGISKELRAFLDEEAGNEISDQRRYIDDMLAVLYQMNHKEVRTFDPLDEEQEESQEASKTQGTPPRAQKVRPAEEAATTVDDAGRDKEGVLSLGVAPGG
jgi:hypothetical protein